MKFAYADPPYLGMAKRYDHPEAHIWDDPETHRALIQRLCTEFPDGWAMSLHLPSLATLLPMCPPKHRIGAWVKPFASFKPGVNPAYTWEPVIFSGGRKRDRTKRTVRDHVSCNITLKRGLCGAKPEGFCHWIFNLLGMEPGDEFVDPFPGSGAVGRAGESWKVSQPALEPA